MITILMLTLSILLQLVAAIIAFRLIPLTGRRIAWTTIAAALLLMAIRRCIPLIRMLSGDTTFQLDFNAELIALVISLLLVVGISRIAPIFSDRKRAEAALHRSEERYRSMFQNNHATMLLIDPETAEIMDANPAACKYYGHTLAQLKEMKITDINALTREQVFKEMELAKAERRNHFIFRHRLANGEVRPVEVFSGPIELGGRHLLYSIVHDITKRKQAEEALLESEEKYRQILDNIQEGYYEVDLAGNYTFFNPSMCKILGYTKEEMMGMNYRLYMDKETAKNVLRDFNEVYRTGISSRVDYEQIKKDRSKMFVETSVVLMRDSSGQPTGFRGLVRDITKRKQAEEFLRQAEERYRSIFDNALEGIFQTTPEGKFIMVNPAMAKMFGYNTSEELMASVTDVARQVYVNPEERKMVREMIAEKGSVKNYETRFYRKDGSIFWVALTMRVVRDEKGQILYYEGTNEDITEHKENVARIRKALKATVQAIVVTVETRDPYTAGHQRRVSDLARSIATEMNLPTDKIDGIRTAAIIHDIGKISVPAEILTKPTKLTDLEFGIIKTHAQSGYDILKDIEFPWPIARMVLEHHERMNGSGYPNGLLAEETLLESRILSVADVVESMASHRPYRASLGIDEALKEIENNKGTLYDPSVVDACLRIFRENAYQLKGT